MENINLPQRSKNILEDFIKGLRDAYGEGLVSVILYGSAASNEFATRLSNINLAVILNDAGLGNLARISGLVNKDRFRILNSVFFTEDYIKRSVDVFPIEFLDMKENHIVLFGKDILKVLSIDTRNLRFQCEQELKAKLLNIKRLYIRSRGDKAALRSLLFKSSISTLHILRNLIRLKGRTPAYIKEDVLKELALEFQIDTAGLTKILEARNKNLKLSYKETESLFYAFTKELERIIDMVDRL